jgi:signal transduction histidine kinase
MGDEATEEPGAGRRLRTLAHDLRGPISVVRLDAFTAAELVGLLRSGTVEERESLLVELGEVAESLREACGRATALVDQVHAEGVALEVAEATAAEEG